MDLSATDIERFSEQYQSPDIRMSELERIWQRPSGTLYRWGFELGLKRPKTKKMVSLGLDYVRQYCEALSKELPPFWIPTLQQTIAAGHGRAMDLTLLLSDLHPGRLTDSFDGDVFASRMDALGVRVLEALKLLRSGYDIRTLRIFALGDFVTGEKVGRNITLEELEHVLLDQVYKLCIPELTLLTSRLAPSFDETLIATVRGNHGVTDRPTMSKVTNWDNVVYLGWQSRMTNAGHGIEFSIETDTWYKFVAVRGKMHLLVHGDQVRGGSPYNGIANKVQAWQSSLPVTFDYCDMGHFHHFNMIRNTWVNATLLTDDDWSREVLGRDGDCGQWVLGCTERGVECAIPIWLGDVD